MSLRVEPFSKSSRFDGLCFSRCRRLARKIDLPSSRDGPPPRLPCGRFWGLAFEWLVRRRALSSQLGSSQGVPRFPAQACLLPCPCGLRFYFPPSPWLHLLREHRTLSTAPRVGAHEEPRCHLPRLRSLQSARWQLGFSGSGSVYLCARLEVGSPAALASPWIRAWPPAGAK